jgi:hypothetical protein
MTRGDPVSQHSPIALLSSISKSVLDENVVGVGFFVVMFVVFNNDEAGIGSVWRRPACRSF